MKYLRLLLVCIPATVVVRFTSDDPIWLFLLSALGLIPLSALLAEATDNLAKRIGPRIGGLLNATLGNATELIISIFALQSGKYVLVKASMTGSILGNLLLVLGASFLVGGLKNGRQKFSRSFAGSSAIMMEISVAGLIVPTLLSLIHHSQRGISYQTKTNDSSLNLLSIGVAVALVSMYIVNIIRQVFTSKGKSDEMPDNSAWKISSSTIILATSTTAIALLSHFLVSSIEPIMKRWNISELSMGVVLIPIIGNVAEHAAAVQQAYKNNIELSLSVALSSSVQIALLVAPSLVFMSLLFGSELTLFFNPFEIAALAIAVHTVSQASRDGESSWMEGVQLLVLYAIIAMGFFLL